MKFLNAKSPISLLFLSVLVFFLLDNLIFRSEFYAYYLSDNDNGVAPLKIKYSLEHESRDKPNIFLPSASLIRAGLRLPDFQAKNPKAPFTLLPLVLSGSGAYTQYYLLKELDPTHKKYHTIILPLESYKVLSDFDPRDDSNYEEGCRILTFINYKEWAEFLSEYRGTPLYTKLAEVFLFSNRSYLDDLEAFLPNRRLAQFLRTDEENYLRFYQGSSSTNIISDEELKEQHQTLYPPGIPQEEDIYRNEHSKKVLAYQQKWLTKLVDLYKDSPTQIVFIQMPHAFFDTNRMPLPDAPDLRKILPDNKNVHFLDEHYFDKLNQYKYMKDDQHLNEEGSKIFTEMLTPLLYKFAENEPLPRLIEK